MARVRGGALRGLATRAALAARRVLLAAADAVVPPQLALFEHVVGIARTELLGAAARLRLPDLLGDGPVTISDLAREARVDPSTLLRAVRALAASGVFRLREDGRVENTRLSDAFRTDAAASMRDFLEYFGSPSNARAWADFETTLRTGESAFTRVHGLGVWEWFRRNAAEGEVFSAALTQLAELDARTIADAYPFQRLGRLCDVGGGEGTILAEVVARSPVIRGVLVDRPEVLRRARARLTERGVADRVTCVAGDILDRVPGGCGGYLLKDVLHDWDDAAALRILRACRRAALPGGRLFVIELLLEPLEAISPGAWVDVQMLTATEGGRQRSAAELSALLERAGWSAREVIRLPGLLSMLVAVRPPSRAARRPSHDRAGRDGVGGAWTTAAARPTRTPRARPTASAASR